MVNQLQEWDAQLLIFLNSLGSTTFDSFWNIVTVTIYWSPLFLLFIALYFFKFPKKQAFIYLIVTVLMILFVTTLTELFKEVFQRLRPVNNPEINPYLRIIRNSSSYSFFSGHASSSFSIASIVCLFLRKKIKFIGLFFIWPLLFIYSRLYFGLHYPSDILAGAIAGVLSAFLFYKLGRWLVLKYPAQSKSVSNR